MMVRLSSYFAKWSNVKGLYKSIQSSPIHLSVPKNRLKCVSSPRVEHGWVCYQKGVGALRQEGASSEPRD